MSIRNLPYENRICKKDDCKKEFKPNSSNQLYCSGDCQYAAQLARLNERNYQKSRTTVKTCQNKNCGKEYTIGLYKYCSETCRKEVWSNKEVWRKYKQKNKKPRKERREIRADGAFQLPKSRIKYGGELRVGWGARRDAERATGALLAAVKEYRMTGTEL